ncbi:MAG: DUF3865 domain-containing protein [Flavobacteriales bacterium]|nr:DUF3865 domain-containing protein [Flavobacteriales bacterium]
MTYQQRLTESIKTFIENSPEKFDECLSSIKEFVKDNFDALHLDSNPIVTNLEKMTVEQVNFAIKEYAAFSQEAIHMLLDAMLRNHDWPKLFEELQHNIDEEKGEETKGIPHLEIMREGYRKDLGLEVDYKDRKPSLVTQRFLSTMRRIFNSDDNAFSAGALLAFEGTAIQEFHILDAIVRAYHQSTKGSQKALSKSLTEYYIDGHKDFEIGHEAHLISSIKPYINQENIQRMCRGYLAVTLAMDIWWKELLLESYQHDGWTYLIQFEEQLTSVEHIMN